jgi:hypothetical protein
MVLEEKELLFRFSYPVLQYSNTPSFYGQISTTPEASKRSQVEIQTQVN